MDRFYTPEEIAEKLKVHSQTILAYIRSGKLKAIRLEKRFRIAEADFENFIKSSSNRPITPEDHLIQVSVERRYSVLRKILMRPVTLPTDPIPNHRLELMLEKAIVRSNQGFRAF